MKLIFIRHGDPNYEDDTLTERGWREAEALVKRISKWNVDEFYCSPLGRAKDTASLTLKAMERTAETKAWLKEFFVPVKDPNTGEMRIPWDFMPSYWTNEPELYDKDKWSGHEIMQTGNIESEYRAVCDGIDEILEKHGYTRKDRVYITENGSEKTLVFFCHLGVQFVILSHLLGISPSVLWQSFFVAPTSVTVLATEEREKGIAYFRCKKLGDTSHLFNEGIEPSNSGFFNEIFG